MEGKGLRGERKEANEEEVGDSQLLDLGSYMDGGIFTEREQRDRLEGGAGTGELVYVW